MLEVVRGFRSVYFNSDARIMHDSGNSWMGFCFSMTLGCRTMQFCVEEGLISSVKQFIT